MPLPQANESLKESNFSKASVPTALWHCLKGAWRRMPQASLAVFSSVRVLQANDVRLVSAHWKKFWPYNLHDCSNKYLKSNSSRYNKEHKVHKNILCLKINRKPSRTKWPNWIKHKYEHLQKNELTWNTKSHKHESVNARSPNSDPEIGNNVSCNA